MEWTEPNGEHWNYSGSLNLLMIQLNNTTLRTQRRTMEPTTYKSCPRKCPQNTQSTYKISHKINWEKSIFQDDLNQNLFSSWILEKNSCCLFIISYMIFIFWDNHCWFLLRVPGSFIQKFIISNFWYIIAWGSYKFYVVRPHITCTVLQTFYFSSFNPKKIVLTTEFMGLSTAF